MKNKNFENLRNCLNSNRNDDIRTEAKISLCFASCLSEISFPEGQSLSPKDIIGKMEMIRWIDPFLDFFIDDCESGYEDFNRVSTHPQSWEINIKQKKVTNFFVSSASIPRSWFAEKIASKIARLMLAGADDKSLKWSGKKDRVQVFPKKMISSYDVSFSKSNSDGKVIRQIKKHVRKDGWIRDPNYKSIFQKKS